MRGRAALLPAALLACASAAPPPRDPTPVAPAEQTELPVVISLDPNVRADSKPPSPEWIEEEPVPEFRRCAACHRALPGGPHGLGPNLYNIFGQPAASRPNYLYSPALRQSGLVWDAETLDRWLTEPRALVPGTKMTDSGLSDPERRKAVIAFLKLRSAPRP